MKKKDVPLFTSLSTQILPPMSSTSFLEMASPRPVPPNSRVVEESAWAKLSKMASTLEEGMPMPVSRISKRQHGAPSSMTDSPTARVTPPRLVNLMALPSRLMMI
ncbi:hypothetical protein DSECCO2_382030 [anaerobic digester metagenome]